LRKISLLALFIFLVNSAFPIDFSALIQSDNEEEEIYLSFRYQGGVNTVIIAYMKGENYYIPISQLFTILKINHTVNHSTLSIGGYYINKSDSYRIGLKSRIVQLQSQRLEISSDDFLIKELDYYINTRVLEEVFDLKFVIDINRLVLKLTTPLKAPYSRTV